LRQQAYIAVGTLVQIAQPPKVKIPFAEYVFRDIRVHGSLTSNHLAMKTLASTDDFSRLAWRMPEDA
jgi:hypothetical protein